MNLSDEQWALIQPLLPPPPSAALRSPPPLDDRRILDGVLWKLRTNSLNNRTTGRSISILGTPSPVILYNCLR
jgi:hypothetical protein